MIYFNIYFFRPLDVRSCMKAKVTPEALSTKGAAKTQEPVPVCCPLHTFILC